MRVVTFALSAPLRRAVAVIAAVTLLLAQWAGHTHRIEHPHDLEERVALAWSVLDERDHALDHDTGAAPHHDCAAYDAATLSDGPPLAVALGTDPARADERALRAERAWTVAAAALAYQSRAPPRA